MEEGVWNRAVEQARAGVATRDVETLTLDGLVKCAQGKLPKSKVFAPFMQLKRLSISNVGLSSLADFPSLPHLERLILSDNRIAGGLEHLVYAGLKSLRDLDLSNNKIQAVEDLKPLAQLKLELLDLYECPVTRGADYRAKVFRMMKSLRFLDKMDVTGNERPESEEESEEEDVDDLNGDGDEVEGEEEGVDVDSNGVAVHEEDDEEGEGDNERGDEGEDNELEDEEEDEGGSYQEEVVAAASERGLVHVHMSSEDRSDEEDDKVQYVEEESEEEEVGDEDDEDAVVDDEEVEYDEDNGSRLVSCAHVSTEGELDVQENEDDGDNGEVGEDEEDDEVEDDAVDNDEGEEEVEEEDDEEEEEFGTKYLVRPIDQPEEDEGASDFEPGDEEEEEDFEDEEDDKDRMKEPAGLKQNRKRTREETSEREERPAKH